MFHLRRGVPTPLVALVLLACGDSGSTHVTNQHQKVLSSAEGTISGAPSSSSALPGTSAAPTSSASAAVDPNAGKGTGQGEGKKRFGESAAYVDGKPLGAIRFYELPPTLKPFPYLLANGRNAERYRVAEYLEAAGVDLKKVTAVHFVGGRNRTAVLTGEEIRKRRDDLAFSFTREFAGKARMHWPPGIVSNTTIDAIVNLLVYVEKKPPRYESRTKGFFDDAGNKIEGVPYADPAESVRGTRVYVDGRYATSVKRKRIPDSVLSPRYTEENPLFSVEKYLGFVGVKPELGTTLAVVQGDSVVLRLDQKAWKSQRQSLDFLIAKGSEGRVVLLGEDGKTEYPANSLHFYTKSKPNPRMLAAPIEPPRPGSGSDQEIPQEMPE